MNSISHVSSTLSTLSTVSRQSSLSRDSLHDSGIEVTDGAAAAVVHEESETIEHSEACKDGSSPPQPQLQQQQQQQQQHVLHPSDKYLSGGM